MPTTIEFSHTTLNQDISKDDLVSRVLDFEDAYLVNRPAFQFHALVTNNQGRYGHLVVASDSSAFEQAMNEAPETPSMRALLSALDMNNIQMRTHAVLDEEFVFPHYFGAFEHGVFRPKNPEEFEPSVFIERGNAVRSEYLEKQSEFLSQALTKGDDGFYAELVFSTSLAHIQKTCAGYLNTPVCMKMLELCDAESTDLSFWTPLLQRDFR